MTFGLGVILGVLGSFVSFVPGSEVGWFAITAVFLASGLFVPRYSTRIVAFIFLVLCLIAVYNGYHRGLEYQELLKSCTY